MTSFPWRAALFVSLAINLVVISAVVGAIASGARLQRPAEQAPVARPTPGARAFMQALPPHARRQLRRELMDDVLATREQRREAGEARLELFRAAQAETYDAERVITAFARVRAADAALTAPLHEAVARALATLPDEERQAAIEAIAERGAALPQGAQQRRAGPPREPN